MMQGDLPSAQAMMEAVITEAQTHGFSGLNALVRHSLATVIYKQARRSRARPVDGL
jgi:hypothetical protein